MSDQDVQPDVDDIDDPDDAVFDGDPSLQEVHGTVDLSGRCEVSIHLSLTDVETLEGAMNTLATYLGRYGLDPFYVMARDPDTDRRWMVHGGRVAEDRSNADAS